MKNTLIPTRHVGPIKIISQNLGINEEVSVPLATFETPLWPSVKRGAKVSVHSGGINVVILKESMTRSVLIEVSNANQALFIQEDIKKKNEELKKIAATTSRFIELIDCHTQIVGTLVYLRFAFVTQDAAGHNMVTNAAESLLNWILGKYNGAEYVSLSGNFCVDKKVSAVNSILGRGKYIIAEIIIPREICRKYLRTTPEKLVALNIKKNLVGSIIAGGVLSANAHFANMLLAFYLATGQDAANIVEGSQGITYTETRPEGLYFSVTLPSVIIGTVGNSKNLPSIKDNLQLMGCLEMRPAGENARRLAVIAAATVLCGELSLLAALTNQGELMRGHLKMERKNERIKKQ